MKKHNLAFLLILLALSSYGQVNIGISKSWANIYVSELKQDVFDEIKNSKTIFVIPNELDENSFKQIINNVWTINDIEFISEDNFDYNKFSKNVIIKLINKEGRKDKVTFDSAVPDKTVKEYIIFNFSLFTPSQSNAVAQIFFTPNIKKREVITNSSNRKSILEKAIIKKKQKKNKEIAGFYNFELGYIKNYFQFLNSHLDKNINAKLRDLYIDKHEIKNLKKSTLFAPHWMMKRYDPFSSTIKKIEKPEKYFSKYNHNYALISNEDLNNKILNSKENFYYLMHTQVNENKIISVINGKTGNIIFRKTSKTSYNINSKDISDLNKEI
ncbi:hypothetical protein [Algibacter sp. L1A34]|uniref:hypothetical protein n=1 Tax=Algibacter sp. L1A34 TaxID=2686365 RepID=UPI00131BFB7E|nr:hypothetical protein [Algibacter sp. L1A34]